MNYRLERAMYNEWVLAGCPGRETPKQARHALNIEVYGECPECGEHGTLVDVPECEG